MIPGSVKTSLACGIVNRITTTDVDVSPCREIIERIPGWSTEAHYMFFRHLVAQKMIDSMLVTGVYHGRDMALIQQAAKDEGRSIHLTGVDLFSDAPCDDWTEAERAAAGWANAGFGPPPSLEAALHNAPKADIIKMDSVAYMEWCAGARRAFDVVYLDTTHDESYARREIEAAQRILSPGGILCGDDYAGEDTWGVDRAVKALCPHHVVVFGRIWIAT